MPNLSAPQAGSAAGAFRVRRIKTHIRPHGDELLAREIGIKFGDTRLPGFRSAPIELVDSGLHLNERKNGWQLLMKEQIACLGTYGGPFDEHGDYDGHQDEFVLTNCALKMARFLGVSNNPGLVPILAYSLKSDRTSKRGPWDIDPIIKEWWRMGLSLREVLAMYHAIFEAWYHTFSGRTPVAKPQGTFRNVIARWMLKQFGANTPHLEMLLEWVESGEQAAEWFDLWDNKGVQQAFHLDLRTEGKTPFDLEGVWECLWAAGTAPDVIERILTVSFDAKYREQTQFALAEQEFTSKAKYLPRDPGNPHRMPYNVALIYTESEYVNRAARRIDPKLDVLLVLLRSGHLRIFNVHKRLDLDPIAARLREAEVLNIKKRHGLVWKYLESKGTIREVPAWYNSHDNLGIFNSTETSPGTRATSLTTPCLLSIVREGLIVVRSEELEKAKQRRHEAYRTKEAAAPSQS